MALLLRILSFVKVRETSMMDDRRLTDTNVRVCCLSAEYRISQDTKCPSRKREVPPGVTSFVDTDPWFRKHRYRDRFPLIWPSAVQHLDRGRCHYSPFKQLIVQNNGLVFHCILLHKTVCIRPWRRHLGRFIMLSPRRQNAAITHMQGSDFCSASECLASNRMADGTLQQAMLVQAGIWKHARPASAMWMCNVHMEYDNMLPAALLHYHMPLCGIQQVGVAHYWR